MTKHAPRPAAGPTPAGEADRSVAAVALLVILVVVALLLVAGIAGDRRPAGGDQMITVDAVPAGNASATDVSPTGGVPPRGDTLGRRLGERLVLAPRTVNGRAGYAIAPASDAAVLARTQLRTGDILFEIDDRPLDPQRIRTLGDELSVLDRVEVHLERDGLVRSKVIDLTENRSAP